MNIYPRIGRSFLISLALHLILATVLMFITFTQYPGKEKPVLDVDFIAIDSLGTPMPRVIPIESPAPPLPLTNLQFAPHTVTPKVRGAIAGASKSSGFAVKGTSVTRGVRLSSTHVSVTSQASIRDDTPNLARLPIGSEVTESAEFEGDVNLGVAGVGGTHGNNSKVNSGPRRSARMGNIQVRKVPASMPGIASLISENKTADAQDTLADVTDRIVLGGEIPPLPKGEPGGIIVGRGADITGRLNLVRLDDPLHPSVYG